jgi:hypothetical protein
MGMASETAPDRGDFHGVAVIKDSIASQILFSAKPVIDKNKSLTNQLAI